MKKGFMKLVKDVTAAREAWDELPLKFALSMVLAVVVCEMAAGALLAGYALQTQLLILRLAELVVIGLLIIYFNVGDNLGLRRPDAEGVRVFALLAGMTLVLFTALLLVFRLLDYPLLAHLTAPPWLAGLAGLLLMVLLAPVVEELLFRGLIFRLLRRSFGMVLSVLLSAGCFALMHGQPELPQIFGGIVFALAYEWSRNLWVAVALHAAGNGAILLLALFH
ncbi:type II CAAX endopeptidase family protein [Mariprofundus sp. KV]|uniref:CPBP family intramembrane glutamic endopeptidase n=1 Tax=Mariprofundus sp. KV TaxID=2608715 RepID=UPI0015A48749|nr:type II CAAX endopeptidase family protein [Mariprofundus sp. KV]NWF36789.1 CPBP family intramembrane metalloprotease [Mariprofundus sp. KV]